MMILTKDNKMIVTHFQKLYKQKNPAEARLFDPVFIKQ